MPKFIVNNKTFEIPENKLMNYPESVLAIVWRWRNKSEDSVLIENIEIPDFCIVVNFYNTGKWPNSYLTKSKLPRVRVNGEFVDAADYFLLPSGDEHIDWESSDDSVSSSEEESEYAEHEKVYKDRDCLWAQRLYDEKMRREDERAEWDLFEDYMDRIM